MPLHVSSTLAHNQEAKIALHSLWYHHTYRWPSRAQVERGLVPLLESVTQFRYLPLTVFLFKATPPTYHQRFLEYTLMVSV